MDGVSVNESKKFPVKASPPAGLMPEKVKLLPSAVTATTCPADPSEEGVSSSSMKDAAKPPVIPAAPENDILPAPSVAKKFFADPSLVGNV